jgi:hypothetical protein
LHYKNKRGGVTTCGDLNPDQDLNRLLTAPAKPTRPVPSKSMLAGSGTAALAICPCTVVIPLLEAGGTRFSGLFVMEYVIPPIVTDVTVKLTTPLPELLALKLPLNVAENYCFLQSGLSV